VRYNIFQNVLEQFEIVPLLSIDFIDIVFFTNEIVTLLLIFFFFHRKFKNFDKFWPGNSVLAIVGDAPEIHQTNEFPDAVIGGCLFVSTACLFFMLTPPAALVYQGVLTATGTCGKATLLAATQTVATASAKVCWTNIGQPWLEILVQTDLFFKKVITVALETSVFIPDVPQNVYNKLELEKVITVTVNSIELEKVGESLEATLDLLIFVSS